MILPLVLLCLSIVFYSISQLQQHRKLKWMKEGTGFWGEKSHLRKYKRDGEYVLHVSTGGPQWYYKLLKLKYREAWPTSTWLTVNLTDGYHACQSLSFIFLSLSVALLTDISYFIFIWPAIVLVHALTYKLLSR